MAEWRVRIGEIDGHVGSASPGPGLHRGWRAPLTGLLLSLVGATYLFHFVLLGRLNVNWDEFYFLSFVHELERGGLSRTWVTFHVHLFRWLVDWGGDEVVQVIRARLVLFGLLAATSAVIYRVAARLMRREAALFAVLCYLSFTFVLRSGTSFRADPLATFFVVAAVDLLLPPRGVLRAAMAGASLGLALLVTIKSSIHLAMLALLLGAMLSALPGARRALLARAGAAAVALALVFVVGHSWHSLHVSPALAIDGAGFLPRTLSTMFGTGSLFPQARVLHRSVVENALVWLMLVAGLGVALARLFGSSPEQRVRSRILLCLAAPLLTLAFYRNAFPYYYVFILPLAVLGCGLAFEAAAEWRVGSRPWLGPSLAAVAALAVFSGGLSYLARNSADETLAQRQVLGVIHRMFPQPVPYVDRCAMVASFEKVGFFMSSWGIQDYRSARQPIFEDLLRDRPVGFLIANSPSLRIDLPRAAFRGFPLALLAEDFDVLRSNFVHHWGAVFVQGKELALPAAPAALEFEILSSGVYTLEAAGPVVLDGSPIEPGRSVTLASGPHTIAATGDVAFARLRWGDRLYRPSFPPIAQPLFRDF